MKKVTIPHLVMMVSGVVVLLFSFFKFYKFGDAGESAWGSGSTFSLRLPRSTASDGISIASVPAGSMPEAPAESLAARR